jgi:PAS domain S-box-containing protein
MTERVVPRGVTLASRTDLYGTITFASEAFVALSGYRRDELLGQPHRIVRHPDMPKAVFAHLWRTLKAGHPWTGLIKNRCKNGDFYWVQALVTPVHRKGQCVGYQSLREAPVPILIQQAESAYAHLRAHPDKPFRPTDAFRTGLLSFLPWVRQKDVDTEQKARMRLWQEEVHALAVRLQQQGQTLEGALFDLQESQGRHDQELTHLVRLMETRQAPILPLRVALVAMKAALTTRSVVGAEGDTDVTYWERLVMDVHSALVGHEQAVEHTLVALRRWQALSVEGHRALALAQQQSEGFAETAQALENLTTS